MMAATAQAYGFDIIDPFFQIGYKLQSDRC